MGPRTSQWEALLAATMAAWLHQLTAITAGEDIPPGHGLLPEVLTRLRQLPASARPASPEPPLPVLAHG